MAWQNLLDVFPNATFAVYKNGFFVNPAFYGDEGISLHVYPGTGLVELTYDALDPDSDIVVMAEVPTVTEGARFRMIEVNLDPAMPDFQNSLLGTTYVRLASTAGDYASEGGWNDLLPYSQIYFPTADDESPNYNFYEAFGLGVYRTPELGA